MHLLSGKTILITRTEGQARELSDQLKEHGASTIELPVIEFGPPASWQEADTALGALPQYDWVVFASANAISSVQNRLTRLGLKWPTVSAPKIAVIGSATAKALASFGLSADFVPTSFVAEQFVEELSAKHPMTGRRILWTRTNTGRTLIADRLAALGALITIVETYSTNLPHDTERVSCELAVLIRERKVDVITFASSQTVKNFHFILTQGLDFSADTEIGKKIDQIVLAAIGPVTAETTREMFGRVDVQAEPFNTEGLINSLLRYYEKIYR
jgi:uroporphyrinogen III methyltransferase / synthase